MYPLGEHWDEEEWLRAAARNPTFQDFEAPEEDIYSLEDGEPFFDSLPPLPEGWACGGRGGPGEVRAPTAPPRSDSRKPADRVRPTASSGKESPATAAPATGR
jgi:hypothetical protein